MDNQVNNPRVTVELQTADLENLKQILNFSANWLQKSTAPAIDVLTVVNTIQQLLPQLVPKVEPEKVQETKIPPIPTTTNPAIVQ